MQKGNTTVSKKGEPSPEYFGSYEEAADFWETHDTTDYLNEFRTVELKSELRTRHFEVKIEGDLVEQLQSRAEQQGVSVSQLTSELLRRQLQEAA